MNIEMLKYFVSIVEAEQISRASQELYVSQPALSNAIKRLETELGVLLFDRNGKTLKLNREGRLFYQSAKDMLSIYDAGSRIIHQEPLRSGDLTIGYNVMTDSLLRFLSAFHKEHPGITVTLDRIDLTKDDISTLYYDFYILSDPGTYGLSNIQIGGRHCIYALMRRDNPLASRDSVTLRELDHERIIFTILDDGNTEPIYHQCIQEGMKPDIAYFCEDSFYQMELVHYTGAVAIVYNSFRKFRNSIDSLILVPIENNIDIASKIYLCWKEENNNAPAQLLRTFSGNFSFRI